MDPSQFALDSLVVVAVFVIVSLVVKPILEVWVKPDATSHDPLVRGLAVLLGVVGILLDHGFPPSTDGHAWILLIIGGILSGLSAIGAFHTLTGSVTQGGNASPVTTAALAAPASVPTAAELASAFSVALEPVLTRLLPAPAPAAPTPAENLPPAGTPPPSSTPEPAAPAATPAQP